MGWFGLVGPKAMPAATVDRVAADMRAVLETPRSASACCATSAPRRSPARPPTSPASSRRAPLYRGLIKEVGASID